MKAHHAVPLILGLACHNAVPATPVHARVALSQSVPTSGRDSLAARLVEVGYGPGESSPAHSHPCPVIGYVVSGMLRSQVRGQPEVVYQAGAAFYEPANSTHIISANASGRHPTRFVTVFLCDRDTTLSITSPSGAGGSHD